MEKLVGYVHFDKAGGKNNRVEILVTKENTDQLRTNKFIKIIDSINKKAYLGKIIEGPFFCPEEVSRDSALAQVSILHGDDFPAPPNYYAQFNVEIVGMLENNRILGVGTKPFPQSKVSTLSDEELNSILGLSNGQLTLGHLEGYPTIPIKFDATNISYIPRNIGIFGTVGSGKTNTSQVLIEELAEQGWAVIVLDVEGEYIRMNQPLSSDFKNEIEELKKFGKVPEGVKDFHVLKLCNSDSNVSTAQEITIRTSDIEPYVLAEILESSEPQANALINIIDRLKSTKTGDKEVDEQKAYITPGRTKIGEYTLNDIIDQIEKYKQAPEELNVRKGSLQPLKRKLIQLKRTGAFDDKTAMPISPDKLIRKGQVSIFDLSYTGDYEKNLLIAELLSKIFEAKTKDKERKLPRTIIFIEEAHTFISRDNVERMYETMRMLKMIARRGRKRWLALCFITQQPSHLPNEIFELANTRIVHNIRSAKNLEVVKVTSGDVSEETWDTVPSLNVGHALINGPQFRNSIVAKIRYSKTTRVRQEEGN